MKVGIIKKVLASTLAVALLAAPMVSAYASCGVSTTDTASASTVVSKAKEEAGVAEIPSTSVVAGVTTSVSGVYLASSVNGTAITTPMADIAAGYGLASNEKAYAKFSNLDPKKSNLAYACLQAGAASQNAVLGPCVNFELGKMTAGRYSLLSPTGAAVRVAVGIPGNFVEAGKTYAMVCVRVGGIITVLPDVDANPNTITFDTTGGAGAYAIIKY